MQAVAILPARFASTRFPGKPLLRQTGKYLIQHVYERVLAAKRIDLCLVATDDQRIFDAVQSFGGGAVMTRADHPSGTDRIAEVVKGLREPCDLVLNVQGDEPEIEPAYLDRLVSRMAEDPACEAGTLACPFAADCDPRDPNCVKVVKNRSGKALYFSRSLIPYPRDNPTDVVPTDYLLHLGVYAYRRDFLLKFAALPPSRLEQIEKLEQLRVLECGYSMAVEVVERASPGVDTPADYERFVERWRTSEKCKVQSAK
ncbi:MAG: 3-deoxy-manno-octulosonate cytidylyltransferase [Phycisphaerae bacterium]